MRKIRNEKKTKKGRNEDKQGKEIKKMATLIVKTLIHFKHARREFSLPAACPSA
jgi:hypothetical protein